MEERQDIRVGHAIRNGCHRQDLASIGQDLVASIQDPDLHRLVVMDAVRKRGPDRVPIGAVGDKAILDHPLAVVLMGHRGGVGDA